ncbi:MAG: ABC transporter ATP-binding protein [Thermodesulfobacteriota bacterium]|nr:ABC transporter ATP-binding protein [Thermodesulfobacteriota bacterium]
MIETHDLTKVYRKGQEEILALAGIDLTIVQGEFVSIVGPSGSGKTTLLNLIGCLDTPTSGSVKIDGKRPANLTENQLRNIRRNSLGFVFQHFSLIPSLTVRENMELPLLFGKKKVDETRVMRVLQSIELAGRENHLPQELSSGEMQRVAIGRAIMNRPRIVLADEPTGNLDSITATSIIKLFADLNQEGVTVVVVTHNMELAENTNRIIHMKDGKIFSP